MAQQAQSPVVLRNLDVESWSGNQVNGNNGNGTALNGGRDERVLEDDPIATALEVPFGSYDVHRLYAYIANWYERTFGREWDCPRPQAMNVLSGFLGRYGPEMSARIVQRLFLRYGGRWQGKPISIGTFARASRWITDRIEQEVLSSKRSGSDFFSLSQLA